MNWITNFVRPKLQAIVGKKEVPDNLWETCNICGQMLLKRELEKNLFVCKSCDYHFRISAKQRLDLILNPDYSLIDTPEIKIDPLKFKDKKKYSERIKVSQKKCDRHDTILLASGFIDQNNVIVAVFDFSFMGGSMGMAAGEAIVKAADCALEKNCPLIKYLIVRIVSITLYYFSSLKIKDPTNGFRLFSNKVLTFFPINFFL